MNTMSYKAASAIAAVSMLLAASPVSAMGLSIGMSSDAMMKYDNDSMEKRGDAMMKEDAMMKKDAMMRANVDANATVEERMSVRFMNILKRTIAGFAKLSKRICNASSSDASAVSACMSKAKTDFSASVGVMIDAAFSQ